MLKDSTQRIHPFFKLYNIIRYMKLMTKIIYIYFKWPFFNCCILPQTQKDQNFYHSKFDPSCIFLLPTQDTFKNKNLFRKNLNSQNLNSLGPTINFYNLYRVSFEHPYPSLSHLFKVKNTSDFVFSYKFLRDLTFFTFLESFQK